MGDLAPFHEDSPRYQYPLVMTNSLLLKMAIVDLPINSMVDLSSSLC